MTQFRIEPASRATPVLLALAACCPATGIADAGADAALDGNPDAPDAAPDTGTLPLGADCIPTRDDCAATLTCRIRSGSTGQCRPVGTLAAGERCPEEDACGAAMACIPEGADLRCYVLCNRFAPLDRCTAAQTCIAYPQPGADTGLCVPP